MMRWRPGSARYLEFTMKGWLWAAGYRHCTHCKDWAEAVGRNRSCKPCGKRISAERNAKRKANAPVLVDDDWGARANAYYESQIDKSYYSFLRTKSASSLGGICRGN